MTGDDSLALDSIASDYRFVLEHDVSMLEIALAAVSFEDCSLDDAVPLDRISVAYDCWLEALEALHPGHRFRGFGLFSDVLNGFQSFLLFSAIEIFSGHIESFSALENLFNTEGNLTIQLF